MGMLKNASVSTAKSARLLPVAGVLVSKLVSAKSPSEKHQFNHLLAGELRRRPGHHPTLLRGFGSAGQLPDFRFSFQTARTQAVLKPSSQCRSPSVPPNPAARCAQVLQVSPKRNADVPFEFNFRSVAWATDRPGIAVR
jgi:hypothetical protein